MRGKGLKSAKLLKGRPGFIPKPRSRGRKALGFRYERALAWAMPKAHRGVWFEFIDDQGIGYCEVDFVLKHGEELLIFEAKHTWVPEAKSKLLGLYKPVVVLATGRLVRPIVVCKNLTSAAPRAFGTLSEALASGATAPLLHWSKGSAVLDPRAVRPPKAAIDSACARA